MEARAGDVMAGGGGAAGPAPDVRHQPAGDVQAEMSSNILIPCRNHKQYRRWLSSGIFSLAVCMRSSVRISGLCTFCQNVFTTIYQHILACTIINLNILSIS